MTWKIYPSNLIIWHPKKIWKNRTKHGFLLFSFFRFSVSANVNCYIKCFIKKYFFWNIHNNDYNTWFFFIFVLQLLTTDLTMKLEWEELGQKFLFFSKCSVKTSMKLYCSFFNPNISRGFSKSIVYPIILKRLVKSLEHISN